MQLFFQPDIRSGSLFLDEEESRHCIKVLRKREGDEIHVMDGKGGLFLATIEKVSPKKCTFNIRETKIEERGGYNIHIAIAPTKNADRTEWFVEKAVEFGVHEITFLDCDNSERTRLNLERLKKKAVSALKQSLNLWLPAINPVQKVDSICQTSDADQKFIAYVDDGIPIHLKAAAVTGKRYLTLIGPEGDFSGEEIEFARANGFVPVSLGRSRLRTETAGIAASHILNLIND